MSILRNCLILSFLLLKQRGLVNSSKPSLNACCGSNQVYQNGKCVKLEDHVVNHGIDYSSFTEHYNITVKLPTCRETLSTLLSIHISNFTTHEHGNLENYDDLSTVTANGYFRHNRAYYGSNEYCLDLDNSEHKDYLLFRVCELLCTAKKPCVNLCCPIGEIVDYKTVALGQTCIKDESLNWAPIYYKHDTDYGLWAKADINELITRHYKIVRHKEWKLVTTDKCENRIYKFSRVENHPFKFQVLSNGHVAKWESYKWIEISENYCVDGAVNLDGPVNSTLVNKDGAHEESSVLIWCTPPLLLNENITNHANVHIYYTVMIVASCFLAMTILVYLLLWKDHNLHGWTLLSYFVSLLLMDISLTASFISSKNYSRTGNDTVIINSSCQVIGILAHFFFLSAFAWMTVINFDLWCKFRSTILPSKGLRRYLQYFAFGTCIPVSIVTVGLCLDLKFGADTDDQLVLPAYGKLRCYIKSEALFPYLYGPIAVLLGINMLFFTTTMLSLRQLRNATKAATKTSTRAQSPYLMAKLIVVQGIPWGFEVVSWAARQHEQDRNYVPWYWMIPDLLNLSQGIAIFAIFVCKRDILNSLRLEYAAIDRLCHCFWKNLPPLVHKGNPNGTGNNSNQPSLQSNTTRTSTLSTNNTDCNKFETFSRL